MVIDLYQQYEVVDEGRYRNRVARRRSNCGLYTRPSRNLAMKPRRCRFLAESDADSY
jgi:hypothetical protein